MSEEGAPESPVRPEKNSALLIGGLVAALVVAAFLGGYSVGTADDPSVSNDDLAEMIRTLQEPAPAQERKADPVFVSTDDDPIKGDPDAPLTIVEFSDFQCPFCSRFYSETLEMLERSYIDTGKANFVYRDMPLDIHPNAIPAHIAAECADEQGAFWQYHDILFERQAEWSRLGPADLDAKLVAYAEKLNLDSEFADCLKSADAAREVQKDHSHAVSYGVTGTPTFFIGNDSTGYVKLSGAQPFAAFQSVIDSKLG